MSARPASEPIGAPGFITGHLAKMEFQERRLRLKLLGSGRALDGSYSEDFEPVLLEHPRELIQIHGNVIYDDEGRPTSISDVDEILDVDDSPIVVSTIVSAGRLLKTRTPLNFDVKFDHDAQAYEAEGPFDIVLGAQTRTELELDLELN